MNYILYIIIGGLVIICSLLMLDEYCVIDIIDAKCEKIDSSAMDSLKNGMYHCSNDSARYLANGKTGGGKIIDSADAVNYILNFRKHIDDTRNAGVYFSKRVFDRIWNDNLTANGVVLYFALDENDHLALVLDPATSEQYEITAPLNKPTIFFGETICPNSCGKHLGNTSTLPLPPPPIGH